ncbi:hypothetical protein DM558_03880 [Entomomonas moraniae]|uniref:Uncharacterized protein n=1 Tax=Entomomonas moraniae TaxID=2213226 RepID=A0A3S9XCD1_9GAMM|nr:hypothetical protein [Entomomonas moraniae]AZS49968.1 hypothetical protein DM558_03880 [Entomomonas moraniae]
MKKFITALAFFSSLFICSNTFAANNIVVSKWVLINYRATSTPFAYSCDYVRSVYVNGLFVTQQYWTGAAWWVCPAVI